jgi:hypothetical protein
MRFSSVHWGNAPFETKIVSARKAVLPLISLVIVSPSSKHSSHTLKAIKHVSGAASVTLTARRYALSGDP